MKKDIHPTYYTAATITCSCGNRIEVGSTRQTMSVEVCAQCHPFYTGKQKLVDVAGRIDRFKRRLAEAEQAESKRKPKKQTRKAQRASRKKDSTVKLR